MLSKLVSVRLHIGKMALNRANEEDGEDFMRDAKHAVMILEGAYDVLTNKLPASWMSVGHEEDGGLSDDDRLTRMEHDAVEEFGDEDEAPQLLVRRQQDSELARNIQQNDAVHIEVSKEHFFYSFLTASSQSPSTHSHHVVMNHRCFAISRAPASTQRNTLPHHPVSTLSEQA